LAYYTYEPMANPCVRYAWTQPALWYAAYGLGNLFYVAGSNGSVTFNSGTGVNSWSAASGPFSYMGNLANQATIQSLMCTAERYAGTNWC
jgi:hypothetical protein